MGSTAPLNRLHLPSCLPHATTTATIPTRAGTTSTAGGSRATPTCSSRAPCPASTTSSTRTMRAPTTQTQLLLMRSMQREARAAATAAVPAAAYGWQCGTSASATRSAARVRGPCGIVRCLFFCRQLGLVLLLDRLCSSLAAEPTTTSHHGVFSADGSNARMPCMCATHARQLPSTVTLSWPPHACRHTPGAAGLCQRAAPGAAFPWSHPQPQWHQVTRGHSWARGRFLCTSRNCCCDTASLLRQAPSAVAGALVRT